jgi:hypothetical protein
MAARYLTASVKDWIDQLAKRLDRRNAWQLLPLLTGFLFASGRRTVSTWLRAAELSDDYQDYYYFLSSLGHKVDSLAEVILRIARQIIAPCGRILLAIDDTPSKRYGPKVEGAGVHHNPTPGPAGSKFLYGHNWVTLAWVVRHPWWGAIGLPLLARLYVRRKDIEGQCLEILRKVTFRTKLVMAAELVKWAAPWLNLLRLPLWVVVDGAYAKRPFLKEVRRAAAIAVSRLRKDAALFDVPLAPPPGKRGPGRPRVYGKNKISLAKRAGQRRGWQLVTLTLYGKEVTKRYKTFLATYRPASGLIRVVLVEEEQGDWRAYFCTKADATVTEILEAVADRSAIEQVFHDIKEVHGAGQAQTRNYWSNVAAYHVTLWWHTLIELWAWHQPAKALVNRSESPWDDAERRPSHADRRNALRRQSLTQAFQEAAAGRTLPRKIHGLWRRVLGLAA